MTVVEHLAAAGHDLSKAKTIIGTGTMECDSIHIRTFICRPWEFGMALAVEATAKVLFTDGTIRPMPVGWRSDHSITAYFPIEQD